MGKIVSKLDGLFFSFLIPFGLTIGLIFISLAVLGFDMKEVPIVNHLIAEKGKTVDTEQSKETLAKIEGLKKELAQKEKSYDQLQQKYEAKQQELDQLHSSDNQSLNGNTAQTASDNKKAYKELAKVYIDMIPKKAAAIIENLDFQEAALVLNEMTVSQQGELLSRMAPEKASKISILLKDEKIEKSANANEW